MDEVDLVERQKVEKWNKIRKARFEAHNREWMKWAREEMKISDDGLNYDEIDYGANDEHGLGHGMYGDMDDSGQWMVGGSRQENIAYDMSLLGGEGDDWHEGKAESYY